MRALLPCDEELREQQIHQLRMIFLWTVDLHATKATLNDDPSTFYLCKAQDVTDRPCSPKKRQGGKLSSRHASFANERKRGGRKKPKKHRRGD